MQTLESPHGPHRTFGADESESTNHRDGRIPANLGPRANRRFGEVHFVSAKPGIVPSIVALLLWALVWGCGFGSGCPHRWAPAMVGYPFGFGRPAAKAPERTGVVRPFWWGDDEPNPGVVVVGFPGSGSPAAVQPTERRAP
jgi:hypothetical protein